MYDLLCFSRKIARKLFKKKKKKNGRELVWEKQGKRKYGAGEIEKLVMYNWVKNVRVFFCNFFYYIYIILIWHQNNAVLRLTLILISISKLHHFGISLKKKKKKNLNYNISILNPKIIRYPTSPSPINVSSLPLCFCLLTLYLCCYYCLLPLPLDATILGVSFFPLSFLLFSGSIL